MYTRRNWIERSEERHFQHASATYHAFLTDLIHIHPMPKERAEQAAVGVLWALEQRILHDEARNLEAQLPTRLVELLHSYPRATERPIKFGELELVEWVANDLHVPVVEAEGIVRAVFKAVRRKITEGEANDVAAELPWDLALLWRHPP
jgi:uncharacterized protein (DUF2267 family)